MSATGGLICWKCGATLAALPQPFQRSTRCPACEADLYVCRLCRHYRPKLNERCAEPRAEAPRDAEHANFCDWFTPHPLAPIPDPDTAQQQARSQLDTLFGKPQTDTTHTSGTDRNALDDLFPTHKD